MPDGVVVRIGTTEDCDLRITDDPYVSNQHAAVIQLGDGRAVVADKGSTNGTYVCRRGSDIWVKVVGPTPISPGDSIKVGRTVIPWSPS